jgi:hypothetical protein
MSVFVCLILLYIGRLIFASVLDLAWPESLVLKKSLKFWHSTYTAVKKNLSTPEVNALLGLPRL